jgi:hypothetical protein
MKKPRLLTIAIVLSPIVLVVLAFCVWLLLGEPWVFSSNWEMDINSGDLRHQACIFCMPGNGRPYESPLSHEIRRLGIAIPATRVWKRIGQSCIVQRISINYVYRHVLLECDDLLDTLDEVEAPDEERRAVLESLMTSLRIETGDRAWWQACLLRNDVASKRSMRIFTPEFEEALKKMRSE